MWSPRQTISTVDVYVYKNTHDVVREIGTMKNDYRLNSTFGIKCVVSDYGEYIKCWGSVGQQRRNGAGLQKRRI